MSAWVVSKAHIDLLVSALSEFEIRHELGEDDREIGQALWRENVESVAYRYQLATRDDERKGELAEYTAAIKAYQPREYVALKPGPLLRAVHCYEYQSCEHDGWDLSRAKNAIRRLGEKLAEQLPGYQSAPWGVDEKNVEAFCAPAAISLTSLANQVQAGRTAARLRRR